MILWVALGKEYLMIGVATRLDPLPTTFDHPSRILRWAPECVNRQVVITLTKTH